MQKWIGTASAALLLASCQGEESTGAAHAPAPKTVITSAKLKGSTLTIGGPFFAVKSTVTLGGTTLKVVGSSATELVATMPTPLDPGTYLLAVSGGTLATSDSMAITVGMVGPQGPPGTGGQQGPQGPPGTCPPGLLVLGETPSAPKGFVFSGSFLTPGGGASGWTTKGPAPAARSGSSVGAVRGTLYIFGGAIEGAGVSTVDAYEPFTDSWTTKPPMPTARYGAGVGVIDGMVYVVGGLQKPQTRVTALEAFDPASNKWTVKGPIPIPLEGISAAVVNRVLYVVGRSAGAAVMLSYDPTTDTWTRKASLPSGRSDVCLGVIGNLVYAVGGLGPSGIPQATNEVYDPATNTWLPKASMPAPRTEFAAGVLYGILYVAAGRNDSGPLSATYAYDPLLDLWTTSLPLPTATELPASGVADGIWVLLGGTQAGRATPDIQAFISAGPRYYLHKSCGDSSSR